MSTPNSPIRLFLALTLSLPRVHTSTRSLSDVVLRSGGSTWTDHVAVLLYLRHQEVGGLELFFV